jgi:hypothetical protein
MGFAPTPRSKASRHTVQLNTWARRFNPAGEFAPPPAIMMIANSELQQPDSATSATSASLQPAAWATRVLRGIFREGVRNVIYPIRSTHAP